MIELDYGICNVLISSILTFFIFFIILAAGFFFILRDSSPEKARLNIKKMDFLVSLMALASLFIFSLSYSFVLRFDTRLQKEYLVSILINILTVLLSYCFFIAIMTGVLFIYIRKFTPELAKKPRYSGYWPILKNHLVSFIGVVLFFSIFAIVSRIFTDHLKNPELIYPFMLFFIFLMYLFSSLFYRLFGKGKEITEGEIYRDYLDLLNKTGISKRKLFLIDNDNDLANGLVSGLLPQFGGIYLTKTLMEKLNRNEIKAIIAHELGHIKGNHLIIRLALTSGWLIFLWYLNRSGYRTFVSSFGYIFWIFSFYYIMRRQEYYADSFAAGATNPDDLISALEKMENLNSEHKIIEVKSGADELGSTHPLMDKRIKHIRESIKIEDGS